MATARLLAAFSVVAGVCPAGLPGAEALRRVRALLRLGEQLQAVTARALRDVEARELFVLDDAGSTRSWLRGQPCGEAQHQSRSRQFGAHAVVERALLDGELAASTASLVCTQLDRLPDQVPDDQLLGVLVHGVPDLLSAWTGGLVLDDLATEELIRRREEAAVVLRACAEDVTSSPAARLEPVFVLLARTVTPAHLQSSLRALVDALLPEQLAEQEQDSHDEVYVRLRKVLSGGWDLLVHLDDGAGQQLADLLEAEVTAMLRGRELDPEEPETLAEEPGTLAEEPGPDRPAPEVAEAPVSRRRQLYDAFLALLHDARAGLSRGQPRPAQLLVVTTLAGLEGLPGALSGSLTTARGPCPLPTDTVRRLGCHSTLTAVLLDALGNPVGASGEHRHATRRQRRALRAQWGPTCAVLGCASALTVPHHVQPWWLSRRTRLADLAPICERHHHDLHEGGRSLRLRDGRLLTPTGWGAEAVGRVAA